MKSEIKEYSLSLVLPFAWLVYGATSIIWGPVVYTYKNTKKRRR